MTTTQSTTSGCETEVSAKATRLTMDVIANRR